MPNNPRLSDDVLENAHVGGFASPPQNPNAASSPVRVVLLGIAGPPEHWKPVYQATEEVCRPMLFPFSPDQPEKDKTVMANVVEYAEVASDLKGNVIAGEPTMVIALPGIDRTRRAGLLVKMLPQVLSHHEVHGSLVYFSQDRSEIFPGVREAKQEGIATHCAGSSISDFDKEAVEGIITPVRETSASGRR